MKPLWSAVIALAAGGPLLGGPAAAADNCEDLRSRIEAKIRSAGVANPVVSVVQADARHEGKVVGTCAAGTRKIVYQQLRSTAVITECKDGSVVQDGDCKRK